MIFFPWVWLMLDNIKEKKRKPTYGRVIKLTDFFWVHSLFSGLVKDIQFFQYHKQLFLEFEFQFLNLYPTALTSGVMVPGTRSYCSWDQELLFLVILTFFLSLIDPLPRTMILQPVNCSNSLAVIPRGPNILPTKLNWKRQKRKYTHYELRLVILWQNSCQL